MLHLDKRIKNKNIKYNININLCEDIKKKIIMIMY